MPGSTLNQRIQNLYTESYKKSLKEIQKDQKHGKKF